MLAVVLAAVAVPLLGYGLLFTSVVGVRTVDVTGTSALSADAVRAAARISTGTPMMRVDLAGVTQRVAALPRVAAVTVTRAWPFTVRLSITERTPVGVIRAPDGAHLVDGTGQDYATVSAAPPGVPELVLKRAAPDDPITHAVVTVLAALPDRVRPEVLSVTAPSPNDVRITLAEGREVHWGGVDESARKAAVLVPLLTRDGKVYDVSSPELPTIS